jgi:hypothetical protein
MGHLPLGDVHGHVIHVQGFHGVMGEWLRHPAGLHGACYLAQHLRRGQLHRGIQGAHPLLLHGRCLQAIVSLNFTGWPPWAGMVH